jgi:polyisoprenyl-teichoic acid--peptidoglycan teichoic acid transferase
MVAHKNRNRSLIVLALIVAVAAATGVYAFLQLRVDTLTETLKKKEPICILFVVSDQKAPLFFEAFLYQAETHKGALIHLPPNIGSVIESLNRMDGIDALYKPGSAAALRKKVEQILGIPVAFTVEIDGPDLKKTADLMGGVELFIANPVDLKTEDARILLPSGSVTLDGDKAWTYVSYRDPLESDLEAAGRMQNLMKAFLKGLGGNRAFLIQKTPFRVLRTLIHTDLSARALEALLGELANLDAERMVFRRALGNTRTVDGKDLLFLHQEGNLEKEAVAQIIRTIGSTESELPEDLTVTVEVLNGTNVAGLGLKARTVLLSFDFIVLSPSNADNDQYAATVVLDRKGNLDSAKRVADVIKCRNVYSRPDTKTDQTVDVTVIIGKDFDGRYCK